MTELAMEIRRNVGEKFPMFGLDRTRDALKAWTEAKWPYGRRKMLENKYNLSPDEARSVCDGRASWATWDKLISHEDGRWEVVLPVFESLFNETIEDYYGRLINETAAAKQRATERKEAVDALHARLKNQSGR